MAHVLIFGDSITEGYWDSEGGWADRLKRASYQADIARDNIGDGHSVLNLGISADTTRQILARLETDARARKVDEGDAVFVLSIGVNDTQARGGREDLLMTIDEYRANLAKIMQTMRQWTSQIILVGLTPVVESLTNPIYDDVWYNNARIAEFDAALQELAAAEKVDFVEMFEPMNTAGYEAMLIDGLHPNDKGHEFIYNRIKPALDKFLP